MLNFSVSEYVTNNKVLREISNASYHCGDDTLINALRIIDDNWQKALLSLSPIQAFIIDRSWGGGYDDDLISQECGKSVSWVKHTRQNAYKCLDSFYLENCGLSLKPSGKGQ